MVQRNAVEALDAAATRTATETIEKLLDQITRQAKTIEELKKERDELTAIIHEKERRR